MNFTDEDPEDYNLRTFGGRRIEDIIRRLAPPLEMTEDQRTGANVVPFKRREAKS